MRVINDLREIPDPPQVSVVTVGNFDGVHLAHQQLLRRVVHTARALGAVATAVTFHPHPVKILAPKKPLELLTSLDRKKTLIEAQGIDVLVVLPFTNELARLSPAEFVRTVLREKLRATAVVVGSNFRFGHRHSGDVKVLGELARQGGFDLEVLPILQLRGEQVSSSRIRKLLQAGRVQTAGRLLGRPFSVCGRIVAGLGVGRHATVPTLNLAPVEERLPKAGVYVTRAKVGGELHESVTNVGFKPTFGEHRLTVESYLLEFHGQSQAHASEMEIEFFHRLRDEIRFQNPGLLKAQIQKDADRSRKFFRLLKHFERKNSVPIAPT